MDLYLRVTLQISAEEFNCDESGYLISPRCRGPRKEGEGWAASLMDASSLQTLYFPRAPLHLRPAALACALPLSYSKRRRRWRPLLPLHSYPCASALSLHSVSRAGISSNQSGDDASGPVALAKSGKLLQVVLVSPQIAGNTGCIARTCAATAVGLHLVEPLGYKVDDTKLKRAGLDYWPYVVVKIHSSWAEFREYFQKQEGERRLLAFTKRGTRIHSDFSYKPGDWLVFGSETSGLPAEAMLDCNQESMGGGTIRIPMVETYVRCLNLSVNVGIALYEASRQLNYEQLQCPPMAGEDDQRLFISEDIYA